MNEAVKKAMADHAKTKGKVKMELKSKMSFKNLNNFPSAAIALTANSFPLMKRKLESIAEVAMNPR